MAVQSTTSSTATTISFDDELQAAQDKYTALNGEYAELSLENTEQNEYAAVDFADADEAEDTQAEIDQEAKLVAATANELFGKSVEELNEKEKMLLEKFLLEASGEDGKFDEEEWAGFTNVFASDPNDTEEDKADAANNEVAQALFGQDYDDLSDFEKADVDNIILAADQDGEEGLSEAEMAKLKAILKTTKDEDDTELGNLTQQILGTLAGLVPVPVPVEEAREKIKEGSTTTKNFV